MLTHEDVPGEKTYGLEFADQPVLAIDRVRYFGEAVAIVAADEPEQARRAAAAVRVEYEPLDPVTDPERATEMEPLHPDRPTMGHGYRDDPRPNVVRSMVIRRGDPDAAGDVVVEGVYETGQQDQAFLGPESGVAIPDGEGGVDIHVATQWLHVDRDQVAPCLGLEPEQVRIHLAGVGGAFGGREDLSMQIHAAHARAAHGASGEDRLQPRGVVRRTHPSPSGAHLGRAPRDARRAARRRPDADPPRRRCVRVELDRSISNACSFAVGPYAVDNVLIDGLVVYTNNPPCGAMRGFGAVQTCFAAESQMDKLAAALDIDPVELRLLNALEPGSALATGQVVTGSLPTREVIRRAAALPLPEPEELPRDAIRLPGGAGNTTRGEGVRRGVGFAVGFKNICYSEGFDDYCTARVVLAEDGSAEVHCAAAEVGQGVSDVILRVARLELGTEDVTLASGSTARVGSAGSTSASRMTWMAAGAVQTACRAALEERERVGRRVSRRRAGLPAPANVPARPGDGPGHGRTAHTSPSPSLRCASSSRWTSSSA